MELALKVAILSVPEDLEGLVKAEVFFVLGLLALAEVLGGITSSFKFKAFWSRN